MLLCVHMSSSITFLIFQFPVCIKAVLLLKVSCPPLASAFLFQYIFPTCASKHLCSCKGSPDEGARLEQSHPKPSAGCHKHIFSMPRRLVFNPGRKLLHKAVSKFWWVSVLRQLSSKSMSTRAAPRDHTWKTFHRNNGFTQGRQTPWVCNRNCCYSEGRKTQNQSVPKDRDSECT